MKGVDTARQQSLLAYLLLHRDAPQARHHLAFLFWPDSTEMQALTNLRNLLHHLRHALPEADQFLQIDTKALHWRPDAPLALDVAELENAVQEAHRAEQAGERAALRAALERVVTLYRGDLLPGCYDEWILPERERLRQAFTEALERLISLLEGQRDYPAAITHAQRLLRHEPVHEATYRDLMRLYALNGDRAAALHTYHTCATILRRELDVQPNRETREAYERLLRTDALPAMAPVSRAGRPAVPPLVGRDREWTRLQEAWQAAAAGEPRFVLLSGEAGIGKTRLAEELLIWAGHQGVATAGARCYGAEGELPYAPVVTLLRAAALPSLEDVWLVELARLLPELRAEQPELPVPGPLNEAWQRQSLFDALARAMLGDSQPRLLFIDDLQWCDRDTLEWLHYLLRFDPLARLLVIATMWAEEREGHSPLAALLEALRRGEQLIEIELAPLTEHETLSLAGHLAGRELDPGLAAPLYQASEGNPFFVVEMVRAGLSNGRTWGAEHAKGMATAVLPPKVRTVIESRLAQLSPSAHKLAELAATIGREFTFALLAQAGDGNEDSLARDLDELWRRRIVREQGAEAYDFSHDKIREVAYNSLSATQRRRLHRRVAQAMESIYAGDLAPVSSQVALHYEQAGLPERAVPYYRQAAEVAQQLYANDEAAGYYHRALSLLEAVEEQETHQRQSAPVYEGLGDLLALTAQHDKALATYQAALSQLTQEEAIAQARLQRKSGKMWEIQRHYQEAAQAYDRAEAALGDEAGDAGPAWWQEWVEIYVDRMWLHYWQGHAQAMADLIGKVRPAMEQHAAPAQRFRFVHATFLMRLTQDRFLPSDDTLGYAREALAASQVSGDLGQVTLAHFGLGFAFLWRAEYEEAEEELQVALDLAERRADVVLQSRCLTYLSILCRRRGQLELAHAYNTRGLNTATAAHLPEYAAIAQANLAWMAWRTGNLPEAVEKSRAALVTWGPLPYAFYWTALWPLIGATLALGQSAEAIAAARALLAPAQMRLPDSLADTIGQALQAWEGANTEEAHAHLAHALDLAQEMGYL